MSFHPRERRHALAGLLVIWAGMVGVFLCLAGVLILGWQVYVFLKFGTWLSKPLLGLVLDFVDVETSWLLHPRSYAAVQPWVAGMLEFVPLSVFLFVSGLGLITTAHKLGGRPPTGRHWEESGRKPAPPDDWFGRN
jgi:hypothetical protein